MLFPSRPTDGHSPAPRSFLESAREEPHQARTAAILRDHPEIRNLIGQRQPKTAWIVLAVVALQLLISAAVADFSWLSILGIAYGVGAFLAHNLFVCIHEGAHGLIFRTRRANLTTILLANLPTLVPTALSFRKLHLAHHQHQGEIDFDADLPSHWEARLIGSWFWAKALWMFLFPLFQTFRLMRLSASLQRPDRWTLANVLLQAIFTTFWLKVVGGKGMLYLLASFWFSVGLHPLGARWIQEHYLVLDPQQETYSYYGPLNWINLNVGYHNEHHDFPGVPWNLLPTVKKMAPEYYEPLAWHGSLVGLWLRFLFDREISLFLRMTRYQSSQDRSPSSS